MNLHWVVATAAVAVLAAGTAHLGVRRAPRGGLRGLGAAPATARSHACLAGLVVASSAASTGYRLLASPDGPWAPLSIDAVASVFATASFTWFVAGGHALELAVGRSWREHADVDVGVRRDQLIAVHAHLSRDWDLHVAAAGELTQWRGGSLTADRHQNNIWARSGPGEPWRFDVIVGAGTDAAWRSRRDPSIEVPWPVAVRRDRDVPYLAPHLQLLMKSKDVRPKDDLDARVVIPQLGEHARTWLAQHLDAAHTWQGLLT